jgi:coenzyme F420-reducing hydrogenase alpha subunit
MSDEETKVLSVDAIGRVEGLSALHLTVTDGRVGEARLQIYEPPRFFESFLRGRSFTEPPDITSRICGICPIAYQLSACRAIEQACGATVDGSLGALRRLLYCGEWIESHALHITMLHAPDFLGCESVIDLARTRRRDVERGLRLKQAGNAIVELLGGRPIHPINMRLGGFHRTPTQVELRPLAIRLHQALDDAAETVRWVAGFDFPDATIDVPFLALTEPDRYAIESGIPTVLAASADAGPARTFPLEEFTEHVVERQLPHSTALHSRLDGGTHLTGPLARFAHSGRLLGPLATQAAREAGLGDPAAGTVCRNPYRSIIVRAVEVLYAVEEALRLIEQYRPPDAPYVPTAPRAGIGHGATEAPRGLLYHRYALGADGTVTDAVLIPPTAQNQDAIEADLRAAVNGRLRHGSASDAELTALCERVIRNHDPCISCATHFLELTVER